MNPTRSLRRPSTPKYMKAPSTPIGEVTAIAAVTSASSRNGSAM